jgi:predicted kinase|tara:strand:+ start:87 stop:593 length:507 start_codon:yes stop_codon:yes gene_type:complete
MNNLRVQILVGISGSGKSTYVKDHCIENICATDKFVENLGKERGLNYSDTFEMLQMNNQFGEITKLFYNEIEDNIKKGREFIIDRTNLTVESRASLLRQLRIWGKLYDVNLFIEAVVFNPDLSIIMHRLRKREDEEDKKIPDDVIAKQVDVFEVPTNDEDFDMVVYEQ